MISQKRSPRKDSQSSRGRLKGVPAEEFKAEAHREEEKINPVLDSLQSSLSIFKNIKPLLPYFL